jgi:DNA-directed RNA polymerase subunit M/transcription elongation factor TFIIS
MESSGNSSVQGNSEQHQLQQHNNVHHDSPPFQDRDTTSSSKQDIPSLTQPPSIAINSTKNLPLVTSQFTIPPLPSTSPRRGSASPDTRTTPNPAHQVISHPMSYPQDAPTDYQMSQKRQQDDGPSPSQRRKLNSHENPTRSQRSDEESDSRRGSASKGGAMSYDPVHEHHQQAHQHHHSRRPSSASSQRSHVTSYSAQSSNPEAEESTSPVVGDESISRDGKKRKHKCPECGQYFTRLHNLKSHLLTHSQEKPFICQECGHKFRRLHDLKRNFLSS